MYPMRYSECSVEGSTETIQSDVILPDTRIPSTPELGSQSNAGDVRTEWNIDEQDAWFEGVFCGEWKNKGAGKKALTLGDVAHSFSLLKKYTQKPIAFQHFTKEFINQLTMDFATNSFVKLSWNFMGSNHPTKVSTDPLIGKSPVYKPALTTKSFMTQNGFLQYGASIATLKAIRQSPSLQITINNNLERTPALFEVESIENTLGNFNVSGTMDVYNADDFGHEIYNDAVNGADRVIRVQVSRQVNGVTTAYTLTLNVHLNAPSESKSGNKLQFSVPFVLNAITDFELLKEVSGTPPAVAATPVFAHSLANANYTAGGTATALDGTATVTDHGNITYAWEQKKNGGTVVANGSNATFTPVITTAGVYTVKVVATNTKGSATATATQSCMITVT